MGSAPQFGMRTRRTPTLLRKHLGQVPHLFSAQLISQVLDGLDVFEADAACVGASDSLLGSSDLPALDGLRRRRCRLAIGLGDPAAVNVLLEPGVDRRSAF